MRRPRPAFDMVVRPRISGLPDDPRKLSPMRQNEDVLDAGNHPLVRAVLGDAAIDTSVHSSDEMLLHTETEHGWDAAVTSYFQRGIELARLHGQIIDCVLGGRRDLDILEFASGFGRMTRFLVHMHGSES